VKNLTGNAPKKSNKVWYALAVVIIAIIVIASVYYYYTTLPPSGGGVTPNVTVDLYGGALANPTSTADYGFGLSANDLTSPGPTLNFTVGDVVKVTFHNVGTLPHSFEINTQNSTNGQVLFNSEINPGTYVQPGQTGTVTFTVDQAGDFYYICPVPGHADLGMWGHVTITS
jgi:uncharacterized cupredoxin-like copper-binding protein